MVGFLLGELVRGEFFGWPESDSFGGNRNPAGIQRNLEESGGIRRNPEESGRNTEIPVWEELLQKKSVKVAENKNFQDPS
jgi:hypothetical protein